MRFVYHAVPERLVGDFLYPLNRLAAVDRGAYELQRSKYDGREHLLELRIPGFDLLWNDTLHCAPLHPHLLYEARREAGLAEPTRTAGRRWLTGRFFELPLERILAHPVVWLAGGSLDGTFEPFDPGRYRELLAVPAEHVAYLRRAQERGEGARAFAFVPHVLVAGAVDIRGVRVLDWAEPPA